MSADVLKIQKLVSFRTPLTKVLAKKLYVAGWILDSSEMIVRFKNQLCYEKENYKFSSNESSVSALEYHFLISKNNTPIKMKK